MAAQAPCDRVTVSTLGTCMLFNDAPSSVNLTLSEAKQVGASLSFIAAQSPQEKEAAVCVCLRGR